MRRVTLATATLGAFIATAAAALPFAASAQDLGDIFRSALACRVIEPALAELPVASLYRRDGASCTAGVPDTTAAAVAGESWYLDAACERPVTLSATPLGDWCDTLLDPTSLGEGQALVTGAGGVPAWTRSPGSRLDLGARRLEGETGSAPEPWLAREVFRTVDTAGGRCALEMRVYAPRPVVDGAPADAASGADPAVPVANGRALIAWHGGSWSNRGFGFLGLELTIPHFVARGFTVYAPFYRLLGDGEGSAACRNADFEADIISDASAALDWVQANGARYGTTGEPVLFGQSAGGQLAARLAVDRADEVAGAVLFYTPTDFEDFAVRAASGAYADEQGLGILEKLLGTDASQADVSVTPIPENALPQRIVRDGIDAPPMFLLHGDADTLVEPRQSVRLCDALAGRELLASDAPLDSVNRLREVVDCGNGSTLHRVRQGQHALDVCPAAGPIPLDTCLSGSAASRAQVADSIGSAAVFAEAVAFADEDADVLLVDDEPPAEASGGSGGGGGLVGVLGWLTLMGVAIGRGWRAGVVHRLAQNRSAPE